MEGGRSPGEDAPKSIEVPVEDGMVCILASADDLPNHRTCRSESSRSRQANNARFRLFCCR